MRVRGRRAGQRKLSFDASLALVELKLIFACECGTVWGWYTLFAEEAKKIVLTEPNYWNNRSGSGS